MNAYIKSLRLAPPKKFPPGDTPIFYVCSYGGSGSTMLAKFLSKYGTTYHVHSAKPPVKLTYPISAQYIDNFSDTPVPDSELKRCKVIYIFRNPIQAQISVYSEHHRAHLELPNPEQYPDKLDEYAKIGKDTLNYISHYKNYMCFANRNYQIIGVNYHRLWDPETLKELIWALQLPPGAIRSFPCKKESKYHTEADIVNALDSINSELVGIVKDAPALQYY